MITANINIKLAPFAVPNDVIEYVPLPKTVPACYPTQPQPVHPDNWDNWIEPTIAKRPFNLSELDEETLDAMCNDFRMEVFKRACKIDPRFTVKATPSQS